VVDIARQDNDVFFAFPRDVSPVWKIEIISGANIDTYGPSNINALITAKWKQPTTNSIGNCRIILSNIGGDLSNKYVGNEIIRIYVDNSAGTTKKFEGILDFPKDQYDEKGRFLEIEGRHVSGELLGVHVSKSYQNAEPSIILRDLFATFAPSVYTYGQVSATSLSGDFNFQDKLFWECILDICRFAGFDCFVDDSKVVHFFEKGSRIIDTDYMVIGNNLRWLKNFGIDSFPIINKVRVYGQDSKGQDIIYTTPDPPSGVTTKSVVVKDSNLKTLQQCQDFANAKLSELNQEDNEGIAYCYGLEFAKPGDKLWVVNPQIGVYGRLRIIELEHEIGKVGWMTTAKIEKEVRSEPLIFKEQIRKAQFLQDVGNINDQDFSYNFTFEDGSNLTLSNLTIANEKLVLTSGQTNGTAVTANKSSSNNITTAEIIVTGKDLGATLNTGISSASWGNGTSTLPSVITKTQAVAWDIGAYIH